MTTAPALLVGPLLRYAGDREATVWVETDRPCTVEVLGARARTFALEGHHFALVDVSGLEPGRNYPYTVALDGIRVWPPAGSELPPSVIRTTAGGAPFSLAFGSCRTVHALTDDAASPPGRVDALREYAMRAASGTPELPELLLLLGDQVYAEKGAPQTRALIRARRDVRQPPGNDVADFEEFTYLYREAWTEPWVRWLLSTVPVAMIFDDHDIVDNWNVSRDWLERMRAQPWWTPRVIGGLMAYWVYQHIGNLPPAQRSADPMWGEAAAGGDVTDRLRAFVEPFDAGTYGAPGAQWSFARDLGPLRLVVVDSRSGRSLADDRREMLDDGEWDWLTEQIRGSAGRQHLVVATSLPFALPHAIHDLETFVTALGAGRWGSAVRRLAEPLRQLAQANHWATFPASFQRLAAELDALVAGAHGPPPATVSILSGDVHHSYMARLALASAPAHPVWQVTCSPLCYDLEGAIVGGFRSAMTPLGGRISRWLARRAGVRPPPLEWTVTTGPWFENMVASLAFDETGAVARLERAISGKPGTRLHVAAEQRLDVGERDDPRRAPA